MNLGFVHVAVELARTSGFHIFAALFSKYPHGGFNMDTGRVTQ